MLLTKNSLKKKPLTDEHIAQIMQLFDNKNEEEYIATFVDNSKITENDYNISVSSYVEP